MSEKSSTSVYIGAPDEFAEWLGYSTEELLGDPSETGTDQSESSQSASQESDTGSGGILSRLLGRA